MSKSIDKVKVQIPGTMYYLQLAEDRGRWVLSLLLRGDVESEVIVPVFSKNGIMKSANELLNNSRLKIEQYPLRNVCDQLYAAAETSLPVQQVQPAEEIIDSDELAEIKQKLDLLENTLENTGEEFKESIQDLSERLSSLENERVARLEAELSKDSAKSDEEMFTKIADRLDHVEEAIAATKGDDRVPSILTAIDAIESKISQLEGLNITREEGTEAPSEGASIDIGNIKNELGRLSKAFDLINQRLTDIESKLRTIAPSAPTVEGDSTSEVTPPTEPKNPT